jgi:imidazolonepropionase
LADSQVTVIENAGLLVLGDIIEEVGTFRALKSPGIEIETVEGDFTVLPGMVDCHTHICWAGSRAQDYAMRLSGKSYVEIARQGGGIWSTVTHTRQASEKNLISLTLSRANKLLHLGTTTVEVKSGYGLDEDSEYKMLTAIREVDKKSPVDLVPTCLAAHIRPKDFKGTERDYLDNILHGLLPRIKENSLCSRVDIYVDEGAFNAEDAVYYLHAAKNLGFDIAVHAEQFARGGLKVAIESGAISADHLEAISEEDISQIARSEVIAVALPGASLGLGEHFSPARKLLDAGASVAIASDWNPGSAPMGNLLLQAAVLGIHEKLTMTETWAAITFRAAAALKLSDRGILKPGMLADFIAFPCMDYREILYNQGGLVPGIVWKRGERVNSDE